MQVNINEDQDAGIEGIQQCVALANVLGGLVQHMVALTDSLAAEYENYQKTVTCLCDQIDGR